MRTPVKLYNDHSKSLIYVYFPEVAAVDHLDDEPVALVFPHELVIHGVVLVNRRGKTREAYLGTQGRTATAPVGSPTHREITEDLRACGFTAPSRVIIDLVAESEASAPTADAESLRARAAALASFGTIMRPAGALRPAKYRTGTDAWTYARLPVVVAYARQRARGTCELCREPAPFEAVAGQPYLEVHHIVPLCEGGPDTCDNVAALCPNCHRELHSGRERLGRRGDLLAWVRKLEAGFARARA